MDLTQIQITKQTRKELQKLRLTKRESYEEIIKRLLKKVKTSQFKSRQSKSNLINPSPN